MLVPDARREIGGTGSGSACRHATARPAVVGRMGYGATIHLTAIGDTVSVASRLRAQPGEIQLHRQR